MSLNYPFAPRQPAAASHLPLTLISLNDWALVNVAGPDTAKYLQGQLTADVDALAPQAHTLCAHCDAKGKMWSDLRLFHRGAGFSYLLRRSVLDTQLAELKKYAVFSKVSIAADDNALLLGIAGFQAGAALAAWFPQLPTAQNPVVEHQDSTLLYFSAPAERYLLIATPALVQQIVAGLEGQAQFNDDQQWLALEIEAGNPVIDLPNSDQFIPQAVNLQALDGISFSKGCYAGQEMVARAKYRGANKRALYRLSGQGTIVPQPGDELELKLGENWRRTGSVLAAVQLSDGTLCVQAVLNNDLAADNVLRVRDDASSHLTIQPLPYSLADDAE